MIILRSFFAIMLTAIIFVSCKTDKQNENKNMPCDSDSPIESIIWLGNLKHSLENNGNYQGAQIYRYRYDSQYVFWVEDCHNCADGMINVYSCSGNVICQFGGIAGLNTCPDFYTTATDSTMLWKNF